MNLENNPKIIGLNEFLDIEFKVCFVCGDKKYNQFYFDDHIYRICAKCLKKRKVRSFFRERSLKFV